MEKRTRHLVERLPGSLGMRDGHPFSLGAMPSIASLPTCDASREGEKFRIPGVGADASAEVTCAWDGAAFSWSTGAAAAAGATQSLNIPIGNGTDVIGAGVYTDVTLPTAGQWTKWRLVGTKFSAGSTGDLVVDLWKDVYASYPPTVADTITGSDKPTLSADDEAESTSLTGWTTLFSAGDTLRVNVDSAATITLATLTLEYTPISPTSAAIIIPIGDGLNDIPDGIWTDFTMSVAGTWTKWRVLETLPNNTNSSITLDIWGDLYGNFPPTVADSIVGSDPPYLLTEVKRESTALTGWDTEFAAGDTFRINVDAAGAGLTLVSLILFYTRAE
jgi:hypothetical protein